MSFPTIDLSALMSCSLPLQVDGIQWTEEPIVQQDVGRIGTMVKAEGVGFLSSPDMPTLCTAISTLASNCRISGAGLQIVGVGGNVLHSVSAADCYEGGPHLQFTILDADGGLYRRVKFSCSAKTHRAALLSSWRVRIATAIDGLQTISQEGTITGVAAASSFATVLATFRTAYPTPPYLVTYEVSYPYGQQISDAGTTSITDLVTRYRINAVQLASSLPGGGSAVVVDGEVHQRVERDDQMRQTTVTEYELHLAPNSGDYTSLVSSLRPAAGGIGQTQLVSESVNFSNIHAWRLRCSFTQMGSADNDGLLNYSRTLTHTPNEQSYEIYTYPGVSPIAVSKPTTFTRLTDSGSQTGLGEFLSAPGPLLLTYESPPQFKYTDISKFEKRTEWEYSMLDISGAGDVTGFLALINRPASVPPGVP